MIHQKIDIQQLPAENETAPLLLQQNQTTPVAKTKQEVAGLILITISALGMSTAGLFAKIGAASFPSTEIVFVRAIVQASSALAGCFLLGIHPLGPSEVRKWVLFRGLIGAIALALHYYSITKLPLADATVIINLHPMFTAILAAILLGEPFGWFDRVCAVFCMAGAVFVTKPSFIFSNNINNFTPDEYADTIIYKNKDSLSSLLFVAGDGDDNSSSRATAILSSITAAVLSAVAYITVRKIGKRAHFLNHTFSFGFIAVIVSSVNFGDFAAPTELKEYTALILTGVCAFVGQCLVNQGLQMAPAGPGTLMCMNEIVFAYLFGLFIFQEYPDWMSVVGAVIIMSATAALGWRKSTAAEQHDQQTRMEDQAEQ
ncbi:EamA-like transporter family-domain-containing protein [Zychaea mexicana]|uniref:EamA-like transporter family-domain-containing protein n=1 Tax=Zychaea mexicana TaxID=64656 RepID=UPI0022FEADEB|nr:EamA-like transporter family-domain-containing protein [Zychaea mexicana]KAI9491162.1 EamA-like transporter family-domain-containing protein [Zychaea mexicana]